ncbi:gluconokinase [Lewinella sp. 4G2]|uniref:gluconokinase n=1 Tax=Lewinella sp. 4G2 TaxID=1803372 RepID=UPI0007B4B273|nr:FGGY family carbohydrate kinase [Lewinella sp. 4G2]OAV44071.1 hypothetical protein A3850_005970 [Lewinella sp. 4G2]
MPSSATHYLGLDVGTTSVKACVFTASGELVVEINEAYPLLHPEPGAAVQSASQLLSTCGCALKKAVAETDGEILGIGLSCPMHSLILFTEGEGFDDTVYTWADNRGVAVIDHISDELKTELHRLTGTPVHPMTPLVTFRWLTEYHPEKIAAATHLYGLKELLTHGWMTETVLDEQLASATGLYDAVAGQWSDLALRTAANLSEAAYKQDGFPLQLPPVRPASYQLTWKPEIAVELGVAGIPVFLGGSDGCLANLGSGVDKPGEVAITVGTSAAVRATHQTGRVDPAHRLFNYRMDADNFAIGGASNNGGKVIEYWQNLLSGHFPDIPSFVNAALATPPDPGLRFTPYLNGERAPIWDAAAAADLTGLRGHHQPAEIARAVVEGVTNNIVTILRDLEAAVGETRRIHASGGFTESKEWVELLAKLSGREVVVAETGQASAYGAALVARRAINSRLD